MEVIGSHRMFQQDICRPAWGAVKLGDLTRVYDYTPSNVADSRCTKPGVQNIENKFSSNSLGFVHKLPRHLVLVSVPNLRLGGASDQGN